MRVPNEVRESPRTIPPIVIGVMVWASLFSILGIWISCTSRLSDLPETILASVAAGVGLFHVVTAGNGAWVLVLLAGQFLRRRRGANKRASLAFTVLALGLIATVQLCAFALAGAAERIVQATAGG